LGKDVNLPQVKERRGIMVISEACQLWVEQRIEEELEGQEKTGKSYRAIGREIAKEIEKFFEAKVEPETISKRVSRMRSGTNVPPSSTDQNHTESEENKEISKGFTQNGKPRQRAPGGGRKPKDTKTKKKVDQGPSEREVRDKELLMKAYDEFFGEVQKAKLDKWEFVSKDYVVRLIENLVAFIEI